jgi:glycerophosphoryl diester phosphodiesterase
MGFIKKTQTKRLLTWVIVFACMPPNMAMAKPAGDAAVSAAPAVHAYAVTEETVVLEEDFDGMTELPEGWTAQSGAWSVSEGMLHQTFATDFSDPPAMLTFGEHLERFRLEATLRFDSSTMDWSWMGLGFDMHYPYPLTCADFSWKTSDAATAGTNFGFYSEASPYLDYSAMGVAPTDMSDSQPVRIEIEVRGAYADIYFNDVPVIIGATIPRWGDGPFGLIMGYGGTGSYDDITILKRSIVHSNDAASISQQAVVSDAA